MSDLKILGRNPVLEALEARLPLTTIFLAAGAEGKVIGKISALASKRGISTRTLKKSDLERLAGASNHQGVVATMKPLPTLALEELLATIREHPAPAVLLLDGIEDPRNFGAILRVADGAGFHGVIIPRRRSAGLTPGAIKASAGAAFHVPVVEVANLARAIETLKQHRFWVAGTEMSATTRAWDTDLTMPLAIVLGSEERGMHRLVQEKCDFLVSLPMTGKLASLNVATTAAVLCYEMLRQRQQKSL